MNGRERTEQDVRTAGADGAGSRSAPDDLPTLRDPHETGLAPGVKRTLWDLMMSLPDVSDIELDFEQPRDFGRPTPDFVLEAVPESTIPPNDDRRSA